jgi:hypothetical protein
MKHAKKQTKKAGKARKASNSAPAAGAPSAPRARQRDPQLPAAGTTLTRTYKGKDFKVAVLEDGFRYDGARVPLSIGARLEDQRGRVGERVPLVRADGAPAPGPEATEGEGSRGGARRDGSCSGRRDPDGLTHPEGPSSPTAALTRRRFSVPDSASGSASRA